MRLVRSLLLATLAVGATVLISSDQVSHAIKPDKVTALEVYAKDGKPVEDKRLQFAVVGSTRGIGAGAQAEPKPPLDIIADLRTQAAVRGLDFVLLTGGYTRRSTPDEWNRFARRWKDVLQMRLQSDNKGRKHVLAVPGDAEILGDRKLTGFGAVFPGSSAGIGFNRNASWGKVDAVVGKTRWRILLLDTHQKAMGSRWKEQLFWLPKAVSDGEFDKLIVVTIVLVATTVGVRRIIVTSILLQFIMSIPVIYLVFWFLHMCKFTRHIYIIFAFCVRHVTRLVKFVLQLGL